MIDLSFHGRVKDKKILQQFCDDVICHLFPREFKRDIFIGIQFTDILDGGVFGYVHVVDRDGVYLIQVAKHVLDVDGNRVQTTQRERAATIIHEMVHVRQYIRRELNEYMTRWKGQKIPYGPRGGVKIPYNKQPWETEAFEVEKELVDLLW